MSEPLYCAEIPGKVIVTGSPSEVSGSQLHAGGVNEPGTIASRHLQP
ncbi:MAG: hypothetical protein AB4050_13010 [Synechococcus sp.]